MDPIVTDLRRELEKAQLALIDTIRHLTAHAEANAALHLATKVMYSPLHAKVEAALNGIDHAMQRTAEPNLPTLDSRTTDGEWAALLADLDRCQHGRHQGDPLRAGRRLHRHVHRQPAPPPRPDHRLRTARRPHRHARPGAQARPGSVASGPHPVTGHRLDVPELHRVLDAQRAARGLSWRDIARETGLASSTLTRITQGHAPDAHGLVSLIVWLDLDTDIARLVQPREG